MQKFGNLNPVTLFEQHSISEIEAINRKIQDELEAKKENLKAMVGERYRDLIQAADTITDMKTNSADIIGHVNNIISSCQKLNDSHIVGFKTNATDKYLNKNSSGNIYGFIVQIKILTSLPEMIWTNIDNENYFVATQLFIFSRHISTGLKLDAKNDVMKKFPVAKKQWDLLAPFFFTIKQSCLQTLERENVSAETASRCLASLLLLENCQTEKLFTSFIQTRSKAFTNILVGEKYTTVKEKILASIKLLINAVQLLQDCFIGSSGDCGLLGKELEQINGPNSKPTISLLKYEDSSIFKTLSDIILKYKPQVFFQPLSPDTIKNGVTNWLKTIENVSQNQLKALIQIIPSIKTIHDIQTLVHQIEKPRDWNQMCKSAFLPDNLDFYKKFYQTLINERVKQIINISWKNIIQEINVEIEKLITENEKVHRDMKSYVWTDDASDNPPSLQDALFTHKLLMKVKGYPVSTVEVCNKVDKQLEMLFNDLKLFLNANYDSIGKSTNVDPEIKVIIENLKNCSADSISNLITSLKSSSFSKTTENFVTLARLLQSIGDLCPNLKLCFTGHLLLETFLKDSGESMDDSEKQWNRICGLLEEESVRFWQMWIDVLVNDWRHLDGYVDMNVILKDFPNWETVIIEEKDENDEVIKSEIQIPTQLSYSVQFFLHDIITQLNRIIPHTLPLAIRQKIMERLIGKLYEYYEKLSENDFVKENQKASWQYFLDLKVLMMLFVLRDNRKVNDDFQVLVNRIKSYIDPFDYDVFYQYVNNNIKKNVLRIAHGMGCLIPNMEHITAIQVNQTLATTHEKEPIILTLSTEATTLPWFPLLPVVVPTTEIEMPQEVPEKTVGEPSTSESFPAKKITMSASTSALSSLSAKSGAFFSSMSKDWFQSST